MKKIGQSIIELSILGAALLTIFGLLIRYASGVSQSQTTQLKAMREAMKLSAQEAVELDPLNQTANRKNASVLWIEDVPTIEGGEKYGSGSLTPTMSSGSATYTNKLELPLVYGDQKSIPLMDIFINGQHFTFTTFAYWWEGYYALKDGGNPWGNLSSSPIEWNYGLCNNPQKCIADPVYQPMRLNNYLRDPVTQKIFDSNGDQITALSGVRHWTNNVAIPVFWMKIPKTDEKFCSAVNQKWHYCKQFNQDSDVGDYELSRRFTMNPFSSDFVPIGPSNDPPREHMQWQWYPVLPNFSVINFFGKEHGATLTSVDVDYDGHEETLLRMGQALTIPWASGYPISCTMKAEYINEWNGEAEGDYQYYEWTTQNGLSQVFLDEDHISQASACIKAYDCKTFPNDPNDPNDQSCQPNAWKVTEVWTIDYENGDLAMTWNDMDRTRIPPIPKPGFIEGKGKIKTYTKGGLLVEEQQIGVESLKKSVQRKDTINVIERQIQLSNDTGRFDPAVTADSALPTWPPKYKFANPDVKAACPTAGCCDSSSNQFITCFDKATKILHVRTIVGAQLGHKYKTKNPIVHLP